MCVCSIYDEEESRNVYDQKYIALNYIRGWFFIDLVSSTPLSFIDVEDTSAEDVDNVQIMRIFRLMRTWSRVVRMLKVLKMNQSIIDFQNNYEINPTYAKLLKGLIYSGVVTHLFSCGWYVYAQAPYARTLDRVISRPNSCMQGL